MLGDLVGRLPLAVRKDLGDDLTYLREQCTSGMDKEEHLKKQLAFIQRASKILRAAAEKGVKGGLQEQFCCRHNRKCAVFPAFPASAIRLNVAGICCQDWSVRGKQAGSLGETIWAWCGYVWSLLCDEPDLVICECTQLYRHEDLQTCLGHKYHLAQAVFTVADLGIPCQRVRKYMVLVHHSGKLKWRDEMVMTKKRLLNLFGRQLRCDGHIFLEHTPKELRRDYIAEVAKAKHLPERDGRGQRWHQKALLTRSTQERLSSFEEEAKRVGHPEHAAIFFDITQTPRFGSMTTLVPALLRNSCPWSYKFEREMLPQERLEAMGMAVIFPEQTVGCRTACSDVVSGMKPNQVKSMAGNAMHVAAIGVVMIYALSCTDFSERA